MASDARLVSAEGTAAALPPISWEEAGASSQMLTPQNCTIPALTPVAFHCMRMSSHQDFVPLASTVSTASQPQCQAGGLAAGS